MKELRLILYFLALIIIILAAVGIGAYRIGKTNSEVTYNAIMLEQEQHFTTIITDQGQTITTQRGLIGTLKTAVNSGLITIEELEDREVDQATVIIRLKNEIRLKGIELSYIPDSIFIYDTILVADKTYLKVPVTFKSNYDQWAEITGTVRATDVLISELTLRSEPTIVLGYRNNGLFKKPTPVVTYSDLNPAVSTIEMSNVTIIQKPPIHKTPIWYRAEGAVVMGVLWFLMGK